MIKAVIFDLDGTLLDTLNDLTISVNHALVQNGFNSHSKEEVLGFIGNGIRVLLTRALPESTSPVVLDKCVADFRCHYDLHCKDNTMPYPGILELLEKLHLNSIKMAVVSNKYDRAVKSLGSFFMDRMEVFIGETSTIPKKPNPTGINYAMQLLGVSDKETVYVGDTPLDFEAAQNAKVKSILVSWGFASIERLNTLENAVIVHNAEELYKKINVLRG